MRTPVHGTRNEYSNYRCRCKPCRMAFRDYKREYRARRRWRDPTFDAKRAEKQRERYHRKQGEA